MTRLEVLRRARVEYASRGRCTGRYSDPDGRVCLVGALYLGAGGQLDGANIVDPGDTDAVEAAEDLIERLINVRPITVWHDKFATYGSTLAALDRTIAYAEEHDGLAHEAPVLGKPELVLA